MFKPEEMPKKTLSANQGCFDTLLNLLDRGDGTEEAVWGLIRSLETNQKIYQQVLNMQIDDSSIKLEENPEAFWQRFFSSGSIYKQAYMQEIIEALMSDGTDLTNRVFFNCFQDPTFHYNEAVVPKVRQRTVN